MKIIIAGVNMISKNRGVQALGYGAESMLKKVFPQADVDFYSLTYDIVTYGRQTNIGRKDIFKFILYIIFPVLAKNNPKIQKIHQADYVFDLTEGDSFGDIYGLERFLLNVVLKMTLRKFGNKYILLQQTIGPFRRKWTKWISKQIIKRADKVYVRDYDSYNLVKSFGICTKLLPDVALFLDSQKPLKYQIPFKIFIAININGLLFFNSYNKELLEKNSYHSFIQNIVKFLLQRGKNILLVPHTYSTKGDLNEDDYKASLTIQTEFNNKYSSQISVIDQELNACELKYILSKAEFTIASRMHACIGSLTSGKLALGLAYSYKFRGNFKNFGLEEWVINLYEKNVSGKNIIERVNKALNEYKETSKSINDKIRQMQNDCIKNFKSDLIHE